MAFSQVQFFSRALNVASTVNVILPEPDMGIGITAARDERLPQVLYLLHGYSDDHSIWMRRTSIERYAASHNLCVIMPAVNHSFYTNEAHGEKYWDYVSEELPRIMHTFFRLSEAREDTFVAGLSMGGYGAMKLALTHPERFAAAGSFSGAVDMVTAHKTREDRQDTYYNIFGDLETLKNTEHDLFYLLKKAAKAPEKPKLYVSCGTKDFLYKAHQKFVKAIEKTDFALTHAEVPDRTHEWALWDSEIARFLELYVR
ncbi:MAG: esterase family protein [Clostridia bacterium]|nr:esterase family protein [Clostridia bacterium]